MPSASLVACRASNGLSPYLPLAEIFFHVALCWIIVHIHLFSHGALLHCISDTVADNWTAQRHARSVVEVRVAQVPAGEIEVFTTKGALGSLPEISEEFCLSRNPWRHVAEAECIHTVARQVSPDFGEPPLGTATDKENS